jgi:hypothetical protein
MKTIINKARRPIKISLPGGKTLHLGLAGRGQVPDDVLDRPAFKKLLEAGEIEVLGEEDRSVVADEKSTRIRQSTHGHPALRNISRKGDR